MPCDSKPFRSWETLEQRKETVREKTMALSAALAAGRVQVKVGKQGAVAFIGWDDREGITDACAYRRIMRHGSALAKNAIMRAAQAAGVEINKQIIGQGAHSHDGGETWHNHKG